MSWNLGIISAKAQAISKKAMVSGLIYVVTLNLDTGKNNGKKDSSKANNPPIRSI